jgi:hypothetical protein
MSCLKRANWNCVCWGRQYERKQAEPGSGYCKKSYSKIVYVQSNFILNVGSFKEEALVLHQKLNENLRNRSRH